jgi:nitrogen PTS system EIIA component
MQFSQIIISANVCIDTTSQSKTAVLHRICKLLCESSPCLEIQSLFEAYWNRENLGSTAIGHGNSIPNVRVPLLTTPIACFIKLIYPVEFGAEDKQPVDLVIGLAAPQNQSQQHLTILNSLIKKFSNPDFRKACRKSTDPEFLYTLLANESVEPACT